MSKSMDEYLQRYTSNGPKIKSSNKQKTTKKKSGLMIVENNVNIKLESEKKPSNNEQELTYSTNQKLQIKNGIQAIEETKKIHQANIRSNYSRNNFVNVENGSNNKVDDNPKQSYYLDKNETLKDSPQDECIKQPVRIRKDSDEDLDIERPSTHKKSSPSYKRKIIDAEIIRSNNNNNDNDLLNNQKITLSNNENETVYRDRTTGKKIDFKLERIEKRRAEERQLEITQQYQKWGKGLKQMEETTKKHEDELYEMSKPLNRYADDQDLEIYLKKQDRPDDPMFEYLNRKKQKKLKNTTTKSEINDTNKCDKPKYQGPMPEPNRFGIPPGHRWDGVDRSNGFERTRFKYIAERKALDYESYKWDVEEM